VASPRILRQLRAQSERYWMAALVACTATTANLALSAVYLALTFEGLTTIIALASFSLLVRPPCLSRILVCLSVSRIRNITIQMTVGPRACRWLRVGTLKSPKQRQSRARAAPRS
jgi:hypothetical protein